MSKQTEKSLEEVETNDETIHQGFELGEIATFADVPVVNYVTKQVLKHRGGKTIGIKILTAIEKSTKVIAGEEKKGREKPFVCDVFPLTLNTAGKIEVVANCAPMTYILGTICKKELEAMYPNETYVNKLFLIEKSLKKSGMDAEGNGGYFTYNIRETK